ncbi:phosphotransferase family protein [Rugosimonospora africana]|uniref:Phosphotransferase n=1 Tax=Rugosimonospora africana TaxID=556532 RepID=A0A8J3VQA7_9ACTN|nr:aminoglycoside phosphotransferase family protein [Rugosimonospora africana]GIH14949.1 phosphotransferase [Rugosimonospora africana]
MTGQMISYLAVISERHELPGNGAIELRRGQFHDVVLTGTTAYRFPRHEVDRMLLHRRATVLSAMAAQNLGFAVPVPLAVPNLDEPVGRCYLATSRVPGEPLADGGAHVSPHRLGAELCSALAALSSATEHVGQLVGEPTPNRWAGFAADVEQELFPLMSARGRQRARHELDRVLALPPPTTPVLVHGDLGGDNLLWDSGPPLRLASVIDWDALFLGSPSHDVASIAATYGWAVAAQAAQSTGDADATLNEARRIQATFALQQALPAQRSGDTAKLDDGLHGYR